MCLQFIFGGLGLKKCTTTNLQVSQLCGMIHSGENFVLTSNIPDMWSGILIRVWFQIALSHSTNDALQTCRIDPLDWNNVSPLQLTEGIKIPNIGSSASYGTFEEGYARVHAVDLSTDMVATAGWEFHFTEASGTKRWAVSETNVSPEVAVGALFTNDRTISLPYRLCPVSLWKHLSPPYTLWQKQHISEVMFLTHFINICIISMCCRVILLYFHAVCSWAYSYFNLILAQ